MPEMHAVADPLKNLHRLFDCNPWPNRVLCNHSGWSKDLGLIGRRRFFSATSF